MNILITGGTSGLGFYTALKLAEDHSNKILLIGSNSSKGVKATKKIVSITKNNNISYLEADLSSIRQISLLAKNLMSEKFDILINNAGALWWMDMVDTPMKRYVIY